MSIKHEIFILKITNFSSIFCRQNHQSTPSTTTTTPTTTTPSTTSTTTIRTELPDWIGLGPSLPGCSRNTAEFCQQNNGSGGKKLKTQRPKYPRSRRRYERKRNNNQKKSGKTQKQKRKERRKRKKKERRRRQRRLRKQRNKQNNIQNQKQSRVYKMGDYALNMDKQRENRRIQWSSILGSSQKNSKIPPFEALLSSAGSSVKNKQNSEENNNKQNNEEEYEDLSDPSSYFDEISTSDFQTKSGNSGSRRNGRKRTPLPLKEARDDLPDQNGDQRGWKRRKRK